MKTPTPGSDLATDLLRRAHALLRVGALTSAEVDRFIEDLSLLDPRSLVGFDEASRPAYGSGLDTRAITALRGTPRDGLRWWERLAGRQSEPPPAALALWHVLGLVSGDGRERERAVADATLSPLTTRLLTIRCLDWVQAVRSAALERLDECPPMLLAGALPLAAQLAAERARGTLLDGLLDARLTDDDLRVASATDDPRTRRAAWRRLGARGVLTAAEAVDRAARDPDVLVRGVAANALPSLPEAGRRAVAGVLLHDPVGWVAASALGALVELDGAAAVEPALLAPTAAVRRAARDWAVVRGVDARAHYLERLRARPDDAVALLALAELTDREDTDRYRSMLRDARARVRAAGLRALARVQPAEARRAAIGALDGGEAGRVVWAATEVLRGAAPSVDEALVLERLALDRSQTPGRRLRALALLRPDAWRHLTVALAVLAGDDGTLAPQLDAELRVWARRSQRIGRRPPPALEARVRELAPAAGEHLQARIDFVLRTSV